MATWIARKHHIASLVPLIVLFFPLLWLSQYNYPAGDDYLVFTEVHSLGTWEATKWWYFNWSGRYANFFLQSLFPDYDVWLTAYTVIPIALFLIGFGCLFALIRAFFGVAFAKSETFTISACLYIFLVALTPDIATGFYWLPSNILYVGAVFTTQLTLATYIRLEAATSPSHRVMLCALTVLLIALLAGLNEISTILFIGTLAVVSAVRLITFKKVPGYALLLLACSIPFALLSYLSPGNAIRAKSMAGDAHLIASLANAMGSTLYLFVALLSTTPLVLASALYLVFLDANRQRLRHLFSSLAAVRWYWVLVFLLCAFTFTSSVLFAAVGVRNLAERVQNVYVYSFVIGWFFAVTVLFVNLSAAGFRFAVPNWVTALLAVVVGAFVLTGFELRLTHGNSIPAANLMQKIFAVVDTKSVYVNAYLDILSGRAAMYARQNEQATNRFRAANGECVEFPPVPHAPETIFVSFVKYPNRWCAKEFVPSYGTHPP